MVNIDRWSRLGRWFMAAWALFGLPTAVAVFAAGFKPANVAVTLGFLLWAAIWIWLWLRAMGRDHTGEVVGLVGITAILTTFSLVQPSPMGSLLVFSFIVAGCIFPLRPALRIVAGLTALQIALEVIRLSDLPSALNAIINSVLVGGVGIGARLLWQSYRDLLAAR
jgi:hypothetical protein